MGIKAFLGTLAITIIGAVISIYGQEIKSYIHSVNNTEVTKIVQPIHMDKVEFDYVKPSWCNMDRVQLDKLNVDESFICRNNKIWEMENKYLYLFGKIKRNISTARSVDLMLIRREWLEKRKILCAISLNECISGYERILYRLSIF